MALGMSTLTIEINQPGQRVIQICFSCLALQEDQSMQIACEQGLIQPTAVSGSTHHHKHSQGSVHSCEILHSWS